MSQKKEDIVRTDSTQAMQSLFSAYADDDADEGGEDETSGTGLAFDISGSEDEADGTPLASDKGEKRPVVNVDLESDDLIKKPKLDKKRTATRLVSYGPDDLDEELEADDIEADAEHNLGSKLVDYDHSMGAPELAASLKRRSLESFEEDNVKLPPEPPGKCSNKLQEKITRLYEKMQDRNVDMNGTIQRRKDFRNPSIYEKLIDYCSINEKGTNYPPELYDPTIWGKESYYIALAKTQQEEMEKREREKKDRTKIEFVTVTKKPSEASGSGEHKRKTKWDSQPSVAASIKPPSIATVNNPTVVSVTTSASGTKTTVISAVGTLKKPK